MYLQNFVKLISRNIFAEPNYHILIKIAQSLSPLSPYISKIEPSILMKLCMWPRYIPRKVYVKFQLILPINKKFLLMAKRKAAGGRFGTRVIHNLDLYVIITMQHCKKSYSEWRECKSRWEMAKLCNSNWMKVST